MTKVHSKGSKRDLKRRCEARLSRENEIKRPVRLFSLFFLGITPLLDGREEQRFNASFRRYFLEVKTSNIRNDENHPPSHTHPLSTHLQYPQIAPQHLDNRPNSSGKKKVAPPQCVGIHTGFTHARIDRRRICTRRGR